MKYAILSFARSLGLLPLVDRVQFYRRRALSARRNRAFLRRHPDFAVPPAELAYDAYNNVDWQVYDEVGRAQAGVLAAAILAHAPAGPLDVLEWGCGPARLIRHFPGLLGPRLRSLTGSDYNAATIDWCQRHFPHIRFAINGLMPPLPFADASFDAVYNFSVFTHLSRAAHDAWTAELLRVLRPGGLLVSTTHGESYRYLLTRATEQAAYAAGELVTQDKVAEGKKFFFAIHPPAFVRDTMFRDYVDVRTLPVPAAAGLEQTVWLARRPAAAA